MIRISFVEDELLILLNDKYNITVEIDRTYSLNSTSNKKYHYEFYMHDNLSHPFFRVFRITVKNSTDKKYITLIGELFGGIENCAVLDGDILVVLMNDEVAFIDLYKIELKRVIKVSDSSCFSIHYFNNGYIIHGELDIVYIDKSMELGWSYSGKDIFATADGENDFEIKDNKVIVKDWQENLYVLDYEGKLINYTV